MKLKKQKQNHLFNQKKKKHTSLELQTHELPESHHHQITSTDKRKTFPDKGWNSQQQQIEVDTKTTKSALRIAEKTREIGASTLVELTVQAGILFSFFN